MSKKQNKQSQNSSVKIEEEKIIIKGFLVIHDLPSEGRLDAHLKEVFKGFEIGNKQIKLVTGWFYNRLKSLRRKYYNILNEHAVYVGFGYIIPTFKLRSFIKKIEELKKEYEDYERKLKAFLLEGKIPDDIDERAVIDKEFTKLVKEYLKEQGVDVEHKIKSITIVDGFKVRLIPFSLSYEFIQDFVDEKIRNEVLTQVEKVRRELVENVRREIEEKARAILNKLVKYVEQKAFTDYIVESLKREVEEVKKLASEFGVKVSSIELIEDVLKTPKEEFAKKVHEVKVKLAEGRVKALLTEIS